MKLYANNNTQIVDQFLFVPREIFLTAQQSQELLFLCNELSLIDYGFVM